MAKKYMKTDFSKVIFMVESWEIFDGSDGWANRWILSNSLITVAKRWLQGEGSEMRWAEIINQTVFGPFKINEGVEQNCTN